MVGCTRAIAFRFDRRVQRGERGGVTRLVAGWRAEIAVAVAGIIGAMAVARIVGRTVPVIVARIARRRGDDGRSRRDDHDRKCYGEHTTSDEAHSGILRSGTSHTFYCEDKSVFPEAIASAVPHARSSYLACFAAAAHGVPQ
jgi:hypothetical protein